jgi:hypothetical protein
MFQTKEALRRNVKIYKKRLMGWSYPEISNQYGITPERARQIFNIVDTKVRKAYLSMKNNSVARH